MKRVGVIKKIVFLFCIVIFTGVILTGESAAYSGKYYIIVNKKTNVATVYETKSKKPIKAFLVSCGNATPTGTFYTKSKYRWKTLIGPVYGQYNTRITGSILFHSVWYYRSGDKSSQSVAAYNKLGTTASHGCVRLNVASAKWIYDNCKVGTKVKIISASSKSDPLGKPKLKKITSGKKMGWDPTDPDDRNPYKVVLIKGIDTNNKTYEIGTTVKILKGVTAKTKDGRNITSKLKVTITKPGSKASNSTSKEMKLVKVGTYTVKYSVKDKKTGKSMSCTVKFKCQDTTKPVISGTKSATVELGQTIDLAKGVKAKGSLDKDITDKIIITIKKPGRDSYVDVKDGIYKFDKDGTYTVKYTVTNPSSKKTVSKQVTYTCKKKPEPTEESKPTEEPDKKPDEDTDIQEPGGEINQPEEGENEVTKEPIQE